MTTQHPSERGYVYGPADPLAHPAPLDGGQGVPEARSGWDGSLGPFMENVTPPDELAPRPGVQGVGQVPVILETGAGGGFSWGAIAASVVSALIVTVAVKRLFGAKE